LLESSVFGALSDPTRRTIVDWLAVEESGTATGFADRLPMSRQAVARHLVELEKAGIVVPRRSGRETRFSLRVEPLSDAADWLVSRASLWDRSLGRLKRQLESD
jgi:DNA-binding transcriptional ArsR family regulator